MVIDGRWKKGMLLGEGYFGEVFEAIDIQTSEEFAVKLEPIPQLDRSNTLVIESEVYKALEKSPNSTGFAKMYFYGRVGNDNALVMTRLGRSIEELQELCGGKFSAKTVLMIGIQVMTRIEQLHEAGYVHRDVTARNVMMGEKDNEIVYLVDFGSAEKLSTSNSSMLRRADILSLGRLLTTISSGEIIKWFLILGKEAFLQKARESCLNLPEMPLFVEAVYDFVFENKSDYECLRGILRAGLARRHYTDDRMFDWLKISSRGTR